MNSSQRRLKLNAVLTIVPSDFTSWKLKTIIIAQADLKTEIKSKPKAFVTEEEIKVRQAKQNLTLVEAAILLNITPLTLRRWALAGNMEGYKVGKKHLYVRENLF